MERHLGWGGTLNTEANKMALRAFVFMYKTVWPHVCGSIYTENVEQTRSQWVTLALNCGREGNLAAVLNPANWRNFLPLFCCLSFSPSFGCTVLAHSRPFSPAHGHAPLFSLRCTCTYIRRSLCVCVCVRTENAHLVVFSIYTQTQRERYSLSLLSLWTLVFIFNSTHDSCLAEKFNWTNLIGS